jgi:hypothetical protein
MTLRQLFYRLVSAGLLRNTPAEYKRLGAVSPSNTRAKATWLTFTWPIPPTECGSITPTNTLTSYTRLPTGWRGNSALTRSMTSRFSPMGVGALQEAPAFHSSVPPGPF